MFITFWLVLYGHWKAFQINAICLLIEKLAGNNVFNKVVLAVEKWEGGGGGGGEFEFHDFVFDVKLKKRMFYYVTVS